MPTILVTCAAGRTSGFVLRALLDAGPIAPSDLRFLVRSHEAVKKVQARHRQLPDSVFAIGDYLEASTLPLALVGVDIVFHNAPSFHALESATGIALIDAAKEAGVKHFVYCSVLFSVLTKLLNRKAKFYVEEHLIESGLNHMILQPPSFMQNVNLERILSTGILPAAYSSKTLQGYLDLQGLAEITRLVILDPKRHNRARYDLVGENATFEDVAREISSAVGKEITQDQILGKGALHLTTLADCQVEGLDRMMFYYDKGGIPGNNNIARWLLGREPTSVAGRIRCDLPKAQ